MIWYLLAIIFGICVTSARGCHGGLDRRRAAPGVFDVELSDFFANCLLNFDQSIPTLFPSIESATDFVIVDTNWYQTSDSLCKAAGNVQQETDCWVERVNGLITPNSALFSATESCICDYAVTYGTSCSGARRRRRRDVVDIIPRRLTNLEQAFSNCIEDNVNEDVIENPSLKRLDVTSITLFLVNHYSNCSFSNAPGIPIEFYETYSFRPICKKLVTSRNHAANIISLYDAAMTERALLRGAFNICRKLLLSSHPKRIYGTPLSWTQWSQCSETCGPGKQTRKRICFFFSCKGVRREDRTCSNSKCPYQNTCLPPDADDLNHVSYIGHIYWVGDRIFYICKKGYQRPGKFHYFGSTCTISGFDCPAYKCVATCFAHAPTYHHENYEKKIYSLGEKIVYKCLKGYTHGSDTSEIKTGVCGKDGEFHEPPSTCVKIRDTEICAKNQLEAPCVTYCPPNCDTPRPRGRCAQECDPDRKCVCRRGMLQVSAKDPRCVRPDQCGAHSDPCRNVPCDGGTCTKGRCVCPSGFELRNGRCAPTDPCRNVPCRGGICWEGLCLCQPGFEHINGICVSSSDECDCPSNSKCVSNACVCNDGFRMHRESCVRDRCYGATCLPNNVCVNGRCMPCKLVQRYCPFK